MSKKTQVSDSDYMEMINNFFTRMINFVYNRYEIKKQYEQLGLNRTYELERDYSKYIFEIDKLDLKVNGRVIQEDIWNKGKLLRAENRLKALALIDKYVPSWIYNVDSSIIDEVDLNEQLSGLGYDDFMRNEIIDTIEPLIEVLNK